MKTIFFSVHSSYTHAHLLYIIIIRPVFIHILMNVLLLLLFIQWLHQFCRSRLLLETFTVNYHSVGTHPRCRCCDLIKVVGATGQIVCSEFRRVLPVALYLREIIFSSNPIDLSTRLRFIISKDNVSFEYPSVSMLTLICHHKKCEK